MDSCPTQLGQFPSAVDVEICDIGFELVKKDANNKTVTRRYSLLAELTVDLCQSEELPSKPGPIRAF